MTSYQTTIRNAKNIRFGSAKIEVWDDRVSGSEHWVNLGALKNVKGTVSTEGEKKFEPDNTAPIIIDPVPDTWDWEFDLQESFDADVWNLFRGEIDTWDTTSASQTVIGMYAGTGSRPRRKVRITNTTAGQGQVVIVLNKAKISSEMDIEFPTDKDGTSALAIHVKLSGEIDGENGFGTMTIPKNNTDVTVSPSVISIAPNATQQLTVTGATTIVYGVLNSAIATVSAAGLVTAVAAGSTKIVVTADDTMYYVPITVTSE